MADTKSYYSPTEIPFFKDYKTHEIHVGEYFSLIKATHKEDTAVTKLFTMGEFYGIKTDGKTDEGILHLAEFDNSPIKHIVTGLRSVIFTYDGEVRGNENVGVHKGYKCDVTGQQPITGTMHFYKGSDGNWHFLSKNGYQQVKKDLPAICFVTKYYIEDIQGKEWPEINDSDVLEETKEETAPEYVAWTIIDNEAVVPRPKTNELHIFETETHDINPIIFYRLARPLKEGSALPNLDLAKYHKRTELFGIRVEADPDYSFEKNDSIIAIEYDKYTAIQSKIKAFDKKFDGEIQEVLEEYMKTNSIDFIECPFLFVQNGELEFKDKGLRAVSPESLQMRIDSLVLFNQHLLKAIPFLYMDSSLTHSDSIGETKLESASLSASFINGKEYAFRSVKTKYVKTIADALSTNYDNPTIHMTRADIKKKYDKGQTD
jgi:hypothetical protein